MRKVILLGPAIAGLSLILFATSPAVARGAPVIDQATIQSADQAFAEPTLTVSLPFAPNALATTVSAVVVLKDVLAALPGLGTEVVALCTTLEQVPIEIVGVAHKCGYAQEVVTAIKMDLGVVRFATAIFGDRSAPEMMIAAVETRTQYTVLRM